MRDSNERRGPVAFALVAVLAVALGVRVLALDRSLRYDEVYTARLFVLQEGDPRFRAELPYHSNNHLLNTALTRLAVAALGPSDVALRIPSLLCGLVHVLVIFGLFRVLFGTKPALWTAGVLAISPLPVLFDTACRGYASMMLLFSLCVLFWVQCGRRPSWLTWVGFSLSAVGLLVAHLFGIVPLGALVAVGLAFPFPGGHRVRLLPLGLALLAIAAAAILVYLPYVPFLDYLAHWWQHGRLPATSFMRYAAFNEPVSGAFLLKLAVLFAGGEGWVRLLIVGVLAGAGIGFGMAPERDPAETARRRFGVVVILGILVLPILFCLLVGLEVLPRLFSFGSAYLGALCALGLWGISGRLSRRRPGVRRFAPAVGIVGLAGLAVAGHWPPRGDWPDEGRLVDMREVARWLDARREPLDLVVTNTAGDQAGGINLTLKWYLNAELPEAEPTKLSSTATRIWTVATVGSPSPLPATSPTRESATFDHVRVRAYDRRFRVARRPVFAGATSPPLRVHQYGASGEPIGSETLARAEPGPIWSFRPAPGATRSILYLPPATAGSQQPIVYAFAIEGADETRVALHCERGGGDSVWPFDFRTVHTRRIRRGLPRVYLAVTELETIRIRLLFDLRGLDPRRAVRIGPVRLFVAPDRRALNRRN